MKKHTQAVKNRAAATLLALVMIISLAACGSKETASGNSPGGSGSAGFGSTQTASGTAGNAGGSGSYGNSNTSSGESADAAGKAAQDFASQLGVEMPDGIVSLADPDAIYDAGSMIQMKGIELYVNMKESADWIDSETGLSDGLKYISVSLDLTDYGAGTVKEIPAPEHYYLIEARDEGGSLLELDEAGGSGGILRPVTDMPVSEMKSDADTYYNTAEAYQGDEINRWLLYKVPEETREIVVACWLTDQFSQPHDAAFRIKVKEKHETHTFEHMEGEDIQKLLDTSERPDLEDFGWFTEPAMFAERASGDYRDPEYDAREYFGGWKCYIYRDKRESGGEFTAHLANLYVENYQPTDEYEKGWVDLRIDWYLGIDGEGRVTDESGLPDTLCKHEEFYYNRMDNEDGTYPFATFSFEYMQDAAVGRGYYVNENKEEYTLELVRPDGKKIWVLEGSRPVMTVMPGTKDVPIPASLIPDGTAQGAAATGQASATSPVSGTSQAANASPGPGSSSETNAVHDPASSPESGTVPVPGPSQIGGNASTSANTIEEVTLDDFNWYFEDDFPIDGRPLTELQDLGGIWRGMLNVVTPVEGEDQCRIMVCKAEVQYMGYKVTILLNPKETHEFMVSDPGNIKTEKLDIAGNIIMEGDWDDDPGYIDVTSVTSELNLMIYDFVEAGGRQYALGSVYNGETEIGEVALIRP